MCLVNWYDNGKHYISPHSDDEKQFVANTAIAGLSWGGTRTFVLTPIKDSSYSEARFEVNDGDLLVMGGETQKTHRHGIPKSTSTEQRISFTFRVFRDQPMVIKSAKRKLLEKKKLELMEMGIDNLKMILDLSLKGNPIRTEMISKMQSILSPDISPSSMDRARMINEAIFHLQDLIEL